MQIYQLFIFESSAWGVKILPCLGAWAHAVRMVAHARLTAVVQPDDEDDRTGGANTTMRLAVI